MTCRNVTITRRLLCRHQCAKTWNFCADSVKTAYAISRVRKLAPRSWRNYRSCNMVDRQGRLCVMMIRLIVAETMHAPMCIRCVSLECARGSVDKSGCLDESDTRNHNSVVSCNIAERIPLHNPPAPACKHGNASRHCMKCAKTAVRWLHIHAINSAP